LPSTVLTKHTVGYTLLARFNWSA